MSRDVERRLRAVERALTDGETTPADLEDRAAVRADVEDHADRIEDIDERVRELEAAVQALRGYVGNVRAVNEDVERRAEAALAAAERAERGPPTAPDPAGPTPDHPVPEPEPEDDPGGLFERVAEWL